tara:strand:+ start:191 stop:496 length:306 start_codon:yes stop_codon:yes gene_type:complete
MWYLSEKLICLSLFDENLGESAKKELAHAILNSQIKENKLKRVKVKSSSPALVSFVTKGSIKFFSMLGLSTDFFPTPSQNLAFKFRLHESSGSGQESKGVQ